VGGRLTDIVVSTTKTLTLQFRPALEVAEKNEQGRCVYSFKRPTLDGLFGLGFNQFALDGPASSTTGKLNKRASNLSCPGTQVDELVAAMSYFEEIEPIAAELRG
jgi:hypothetical protein